MCIRDRCLGTTAASGTGSVTFPVLTNIGDSVFIRLPLAGVSNLSSSSLNDGGSTRLQFGNINVDFTRSLSVGSFTDAAGFVSAWNTAYSSTPLSLSQGAGDIVLTLGMATLVSGTTLSNGVVEILLTKTAGSPIPLTRFDPNVDVLVRLGGETWPTETKHTCLLYTSPSPRD